MLSVGKEYINKGQCDSVIHSNAVLPPTVSFHIPEYMADSLFTSVEVSRGNLV